MFSEAVVEHLELIGIVKPTYVVSWGFYISCGVLLSTRVGCFLLLFDFENVISTLKRNEFLDFVSIINFSRCIYTLQITSQVFNFVVIYHDLIQYIK